MKRLLAAIAMTLLLATHAAAQTGSKIVTNAVAAGQTGAMQTGPQAAGIAITFCGTSFSGDVYVDAATTSAALAQVWTTTLTSNSDCTTVYTASPALKWYRARWTRSAGTLNVWMGLTKGDVIAGGGVELPDLAGNALKMLRVNAGEDDTEWAAVSSGITNAAGNNVIPKSNGTNLVASNLSDSGTTLNYTTTLPSAASGFQYGMTLGVTAVGGSYANYGMSLGMGAAGYIGQAVGLNIAQNTPTTDASYGGDMGIRGIHVESVSPFGATGGSHTGIFSWARGNTFNIGVVGRATGGGTNNVGVLGYARDGSSTNTAGVFTLRISDSTYPSAALLADNSSSAVPIFIARDAGTVVFQLNDGGGVMSRREVVAIGAVTAATALTSNYVYTNQGMTGSGSLLLPTAVAGLTYTACVQAAYAMVIDTAAGDTIRIGASVTAADGSITSSTVGTCVTLVAINDTEWIGTSSSGTWTF